MALFHLVGGIFNGKNGQREGRKTEEDISTCDSPVRVFVIPTDEELVIVEDVAAILEKRYDIHTKFEYSFQRRNFIPTFMR